MRKIKTPFFQAEQFFIRDVDNLQEYFIEVHIGLTNLDI